MLGGDNGQGFQWWNIVSGHAARFTDGVDEM